MGLMMNNKAKYILSYLTWPGLFAACMGITAYGFVHDMTLLFF